MLAGSPHLERSQLAHSRARLPDTGKTTTSIRTIQFLSAAVCKSIGAPALAEMQKLNQEGATQIRRSIVMQARALKPDSRSDSHVLQIIIQTKQNITRGKSSIVKEETKLKKNSSSSSFISLPSPDLFARKVSPSPDLHAMSLVSSCNFKSRHCEEKKGKEKTDAVFDAAKKKARWERRRQKQQTPSLFAPRKCQEGKRLWECESS